MKDREIFGLCPDNEFFGRLHEIDRISRRAADADKVRPGVFLTGRRWIGKTEVLRRVQRNLFWGQGSVAPVYYQFKGCAAPAEFAEDFLRETVKQYLAFRKREPQIIGLTIPLERLERLLIDNDMEDQASVVSRHIEARSSGDVLSLVKNAVLSPLSFSVSSGMPVFLILDDMDLLPCIGRAPGGAQVINEFSGVFSSPAFSFLASSSGRSRTEAPFLPGYTERIELKGLGEEDSAAMMAGLCRLWGVDFDAEAVSLLARKLGGNPMYIKSMVWAAKREEAPIAGFKEIAELYSNEVTSGNISSTLSSSIRLKGVNELKVLALSASSPQDLSLERIAERFRFDPAVLEDIMGGLETTGLLAFELAGVRWAGDRVTADFVRFMHETAVKGRSREEARTALVREILKEDYGYKGERVRGNLKEEAAEVLRSFNGQRVFKALFHNSAFTSRLKDGAYVPDTQKVEEELTLPSAAGCYDSSRLEKGETGPPVLVLHAFQNSRFDSGNEVVWVAAVKDGSSPVNAGDMENFLRRASILKENVRASYLVRWMVSREGFTDEARSRCDAEGIWSSDYMQFSMIRDALREKAPVLKGEASSRLSPSKEFEVVLPASSKAELVAARAVEEIGVEMGFDENAIGRIKAAVVEACINAFEHGRTKASKVRLRFVAMADRLTIHVENPGADFEGPFMNEPSERGTLPRKRGWGLDLMKGLMDEVRFEKLRGGTKIILVKYLLRKGEDGDVKED